MSTRTESQLSHWVGHTLAGPVYVGTKDEADEYRRLRFRVDGPFVPAAKLREDRFLDVVLDVLEGRNGQPLNLARWDLKAALDRALEN